MSSAVEIANQALTQLGADRITSFGDESTEAAVMSTLYDGVKRALLRIYEWNCAIRRAKLAKLVEAPANEYAFQYQVPEGCLRVLDLWEGDYRTTKAGDGTRAWVLEGKTILSNSENIYIRYILDINEGEMDATFEEVFVAKLAAEAAYTLLASPTEQQAHAGIYMSKLEEARTVDNLETSHTTFNIDKLRVVRY